MDKNENNKGLKPYESPSTKKTQVELEEGVCAGSIDATAKSPGVTTTAQDVKTELNSANDFSDNGWDTNN